MNISQLRTELQALLSKLPDDAEYRPTKRQIFELFQRFKAPPEPIKEIVRVRDEDEVATLQAENQSLRSQLATTKCNLANAEQALKNLNDQMAEKASVDLTRLNTDHLEFVSMANYNTAMWELKGIKETINNMGRAVPGLKHWTSKMTTDSPAMTAAFLGFSPQVLLRAFTLSKGKYKRWVEAEAERFSRAFGFELVNRHLESGMYRIGIDSQHKQYLHVSPVDW